MTTGSGGDSLPTPNHVGFTRCVIGGVVHRLSTVKLPDGVLFSRDRPYETMLFCGEDDFMDHYCEQYGSAEEALEGHNQTVTRLLAGTLEVY